jgi:hypothetical protein
VQTAKNENKWASEHKLDDILIHLLGWVKARIASLIEAGRPAVIHIEEFNEVARRIVQQFDRDYILISRAREPSDEERQKELTRTYVRQLDLIELGFERKLRAINEYLRADYDRHEWAIRGEVHPSSFDAFETELIATWDSHKLDCEVTHSHHPDAQRGQALYARCSLYRAKLNGIDPPSHFCSGSFHVLADEKVIGWHPNFPDLLDKG